MSSFIDLELVEARHIESLAAVAPHVAELMEARNAVARQLATLEARIGEFKGTRERLKLEIESLRAKGTDMAVTGGDPLKLSKQVRDREAQIEDIGSWLADLEIKVGEVCARGSEAQLALFHAYKGAEAAYLQEVQEEFNALHKKLSLLHVNYLPALKRTYAAVMQLDQFPKFSLPDPQRRVENQCASLQLWRSHTIYDLQKHGGVPMLGRSALR